MSLLHFVPQHRSCGGEICGIYKSPGVNAALRRFISVAFET